MFLYCFDREGEGKEIHIITIPFLSLFFSTFIIHSLYHIYSSFILIRFECCMEEKMREKYY